MKIEERARKYAESKVDKNLNWEKWKQRCTYNSNPTTPFDACRYDYEVGAKKEHSILMGRTKTILRDALNGINTRIEMGTIKKIDVGKTISNFVDEIENFDKEPEDVQNS